MIFGHDEPFSRHLNIEDALNNIKTLYLDKSLQLETQFRTNDLLKAKIQWLEERLIEIQKNDDRTGA